MKQLVLLIRFLEGYGVVAIMLSFTMKNNVILRESQFIVGTHWVGKKNNPIMTNHYVPLHPNLRDCEGPESEKVEENK